MNTSTNYKNRAKSLSLSLYTRLIPVQLLLSVTVSVCTLITSLIISRVFGESGLSEIKITDAFTNIVNIFNLLISGGTVIFLSKAVCKNDRKAENGVFCGAVAVAAVFGAAVCVACLAFASPICSFFGADENMLASCESILRHNIVYYITLPICTVFLSVFQIHSDFGTPVLSSVLLFVFSVSMKYIFAAVLHLGIEFTSTANSASQLLLLIFLMIKQHNKKFVSFSFRDISIKSSVALVVTGITETAALIWSSFKGSLMIKIIANVGGVKALSFFSVISGVDAVTFSVFSTAFHSVTVMIAGIYINEEDREALRRFVKTAFLTSAVISLALSAVMFFSAYPAAIIYGIGDVSGHMVAQRIFSFAFLFYLPYLALISMYSALEKKKLVNILSLITSLLVPITVMLIMSKLFGITGFWYSMVLSDMLSLIITFTYSVIHNRHFPRSPEELLCLEKDFGVSKENSLTFSVSDTEGAVKASADISEFCKARGADSRTAYYSGLCMEEIAVNIVTHGFRHAGKKCIAELTVINRPDCVKLIVRDNCRKFDLRDKLKSFDENDITKGIGIRLVMKLSEVTYKNMYGLNIITMTLPKNEKA